jgi:hypothetical protein
MTIAFALHQDHAPSLPRGGEMVYAIEGRLAPRLPTEAIPVKGNPESNCKLFAGRPAIWNAKRWPTFIYELGYPKGSEKLHRQTLCSGVLLKR